MKLAGDRRPRFSSFGGGEEERTALGIHLTLIFFRLTPCATEKNQDDLIAFSEQEQQRAGNKESQLLVPYSVKLSNFLMKTIFFLLMANLLLPSGVLSVLINSLELILLLA